MSDILCEYCKSGTTRNKYLLERTKFGVADCYIGIDMQICENTLEIYAVGDVGYPSRDSASAEGKLKINYCPMCGRKL